MDVREIAPEEYEALADLTVAAYRALPGDPPSARYERALRDVAGRAAGAVVLVAVPGPDPLRERSQYSVSATDAAGAGARAGAGRPLLGGVTYVPGPESPCAEFEDPDAAGIRMLAVDPAARGLGTGTALVEACIERARAGGRARLVLHSTPVMATAQRIYRRLGFARREDLDWRPEPGVELAGFALELR